MKTKYFITAGLLCLSSTAYCANVNKPDQAMLATALKKFLAQQGDLCLGKFDWPIDVSESDFKIGTRDAVQMPVLEKLGLVDSSSESVMMRKEGETEELAPVKRYVLTDAGRKFYVTREMTSITSSGKTIVHHGDFCAGKLSLNKLVQWDKPAMAGDNRETTVTYTYKIAAAKWTHDPEIQKVFPMVDRIVKGEGSMQLKQRLRLTKKAWVALNPWE